MTTPKTETKRQRLPQVMSNSITLGCDPEFFFSKPEVGVVGAEAVIPKAGMPSGGGKIIIDGVQAELNPAPSTCRESIAHNIRSCFITLKDTMDKNKESGIKLDFSRSIEISKEELAKLEKANQQLGCAPSMSTSKSKAGIKLSEVDGSQHLQRSAGGHIHISGAGTVGMMIQWNHKEIVHMLDLIVGNTCVLLDRDPSNKERRKLYGRAGEYRLPKHKVGAGTVPGLEYRTLSNFWLTSYPLMSLVFGLVRTTVEMMCDPVNSRLFYEEFTKLVPAAKVRTAINTNNAKLAMEIFKTIEPLLWECIPQATGRFPVSAYNQKELHYFIEMIEKNGLEYWFKQDPLTHWVTLSDISGNGFYNYSDRVIKHDMYAKQSASKNKVAV